MNFMHEYIPFLDYRLAGHSLSQWVLAAGAGITAFVLLQLLKVTIVARLKSMASRTETYLDDMVAVILDRTFTFTLFVLAVQAGAMFLVLSPDWRHVINAGAVAVLLVQAGIWVDTGLRDGLRHYSEKKLKQDPGAITTLTALGYVGRLVIWVTAVLLILDNMGVNVTTLIAGVGIGGIAVALAVQNILGDVLASLSMVLDKPFVVGDMIEVGDFVGRIETIGLKTTRLRSSSGELIIFSNGDLLKSRIRNHERRYERQMTLRFGVTYQTPPAKLEAIPVWLREIVEGLTGVRFDRAHFTTFSASSLDFEMVYYVKDTSLSMANDAQQTINLALMRRLAAEGVEFAYPTQTVHVVGATAR